MMSQDTLTQAARIVELEAALHSQRREAQHQVRNLLAMTRSLARRTGATHDQDHEAFLLLDGRLAAFSRVQSALLRDDRSAAEFGALVADEVLACAAKLDMLTLPENALWLTPRAAVLLVLIVHELLAFSACDGPFDVSWRSEAGTLVIKWHATPVPVALHSDESFVREILDRAVPYELAGTAELSISDAVSCTIRLPGEAGVIEDGAPSDQ